MMFKTGAMKLMKLRVGAAVFGAVVAIAIGGSAVAQEYTMKIGTATPAGDQNTWMARFKERVEKRAGGRIAIKLFPSDQLGSTPRQIEGVQLGTIEAFVGPAAFLKGVDPRFQVPNVPGIFRDKRHAMDTVTDPEFRDRFLSVGEQKGVRGISMWIPNIAATVNRNYPIRRVEDYRGLKLRVLASEIEIEYLRRLGASATPIPLMDTLPALQSGTVDGVVAALVIFVPFKYWNVAKYMTNTHEAVFPVISVVSKTWWDKLPNDLQNIMLEEAKKLEPEMYDWALEFNKGLERKWVENGGEVINFSPAERAKLTAKLDTVGATVAEKIPEIKELYELLLKVVKRH